MYKIYTLSVNKEIFYVGMTSQNFKLRLNSHLSEKTSKNPLKHIVFKYAKEQEHKIDIEIIEEVGLNKKEASELEKFYIVLLKSYGFPLTNRIENGDLVMHLPGVTIKQYTLEGQYVRTFPSSKAIAKHLGKNCSKEVRHCCKGIRSKASGFVWRFEEDSFEKYSVLQVNEVQAIAIRNATGKKIARYDANKVLLEIHSCIQDLQSKGFISRSGLHKYFKNPKLTRNGYYFEYVV